jgi:hypothetical protein
MAGDCARAVAEQRVARHALSSSTRNCSASYSIVGAKDALSRYERRVFVR